MLACRMGTSPPTMSRIGLSDNENNLQIIYIIDINKNKKKQTFVMNVLKTFLCMYIYIYFY